MKSLAYLNKYFFRYKWRLLLGVLFIVLSNYFNVYMPKVFGNIINEIEQLLQASNQDTKVNSLLYSGLYFGGLFLCLALAKGVFLFFTRQTIIVVSRFIERDLKKDIFSKYLILNRSFFKQNNTGDLMNRISEDVNHVRMYLGPAVMYTINLVVLFVMVIVTMIKVNPTLTLYVLLPLPILSTSIYFVSSIMNRKSEFVQVQQSKLSTLAQEAFSGIRVLKAYDKVNNFNTKFSKEVEQYRLLGLSLVKVHALFMPFIILLIGLSTIITVYTGGVLQIGGKLSNGTIAEFIFYINMLTWPFASLGWVTSLVQRAAASQERINQFLLTEETTIDQGKVEPNLNNDIHFNQLSFTYPDTGIKAIDNISFTVPRGKTIAITGKTGSGKSTLAALLTRQYEPDSGEIIIGETHLQDIKLNYLRKNMGIVPQEVFLFSDTITNNISFGLDDTPNEEDVIEAAKNAYVAHNIDTLPDKYKTMLGERGVNLSGGQKQRISIARALIKKPNILILDDCLSAVDTKTEEQILRNLKTFSNDKTTFIITHRVSVAQNADLIIVLENGKIQEQGNHQDLLNTTNGLYKNLHKKQLLEEQENLN